MKFNFSLFRVTFLSVLSISFILGCVAAIPVAVYYYKSHKHYVAHADVRKNADDLWLAVQRLAERFGHVRPAIGILCGKLNIQPDSEV